MRIQILFYGDFFRSVSSFHAAVLFLYPLKTPEILSENQIIFYLFRGYRKKPLAGNRLWSILVLLFWRKWLDGLQYLHFAMESVLFNTLVIPGWAEEPNNITFFHVRSPVTHKFIFKKFKSYSGQVS